MSEGASGTEVLMPALLPPGHPHARAFAPGARRPPLSLADVRAFAAQYYRPERMTLVISGPITAAWKKALWDKIPAALLRARGRAPPRRSGAAGRVRRARRAPDADLPRRQGEGRRPRAVDGVAGAARTGHRREASWRSWRASPTRCCRAPPSATTRPTCSTSMPGRCQATCRARSSVRFKLRSSADAVRIRDETRAALEALTDVTLVHIKGRLWSGYVARRAGARRSGRAGDGEPERAALARAELVHAGSSALISQVFDVAGADHRRRRVERSRRRYLKADASRVGAAHLRSHASPRRRGERRRCPRAGRVGPRRAGADAEPEPEPDAGDASPRPPTLAPIAQAPGARAARVHTLNNGLTVIALRRPGLPFVAMRLGFHADPQPGDAPGARNAIDTSLRWDLSDRPARAGRAAQHPSGTPTAAGIADACWRATPTRRWTCSPRRPTRSSVLAEPALRSLGRRGGAHRGDRRRSGGARVPDRAVRRPRLPACARRPR